MVQRRLPVWYASPSDSAPASSQAQTTDLKSKCHTFFQITPAPDAMFLFLLSVATPFVGRDSSGLAVRKVAAGCIQCCSMQMPLSRLQGRTRPDGTAGRPRDIQNAGRAKAGKPHPRAGRPSPADLWPRIFSGGANLKAGAGLSYTGTAVIMGALSLHVCHGVCACTHAHVHVRACARERGHAYAHMRARTRAVCACASH